MAIRSGIVFCALVLGCLAVPVPEQEADFFIFFDTLTYDEVPGGRIVDGDVAALGSHPWMVAFTTGGNVRSMHCGGSILTARTILTAAHCIVPVRLGNNLRHDVRLSVGTNRFNQGGQVLATNGFAVHPQYDPHLIKYDIGTVFTASSINFNANVQGISPSWVHVGGGVPARVAGWGQTAAGNPVSENLLEIQVPTLGGLQCAQDIRQAAINLNSRSLPVDANIEICTFISVGRGTCHGDSGSALVQISNNQQIGVVSWGFPCAVGAPDVYVRVSAFRTWISQNVRF